MQELQGKGIVVVGASAGIGRAFARLAVERGGEAVFVARRQAELETLRAECGAGTCVTADLADPDAPARIARAAAELDSVDLVFIAAGLASLRPVADHDADAWAHTLAVNVAGVNGCVTALLPHLGAAAVVAACSSDTVGHPRWGLGVYAASKAALEESFRAWRTEHPVVRFTTVRVGATFPTDFGRGFSDEMLGRAFDKWAAQGHAQAAMMPTGAVAEVALDTLTAVLAHPGVGIEELVLRSPTEQTTEMVVST